MRFIDIRDQESAIGTLRRALASHKVPHAYLFSGPLGVGKHLTARALAMTLNCAEERDDACGVCRSCDKVHREVHPDVFEVGLPEKKKSIPIDSVRELERRLFMRPYEGRAKVAIIDPADLMTAAAANALLKTLEEPSPGSFIVLVTALASSLLPTVRSRCQIVRFRPLPDKTVADLLIDSGVSSEEASTVATLSGGSMQQAAVYLSEDLDARIEMVIRILQEAFEPTPAIGLQVAAKMSGKRDDALALLNLIEIVLSEVTWLGTHKDDPEERVLVKRFGRRLVDIADSLSTARAARFVAAVHKATQGIQRNNLNPQLALEGVVMSMRGRGDGNTAGSGYGIS
ncbi:MAG: DNA polymerase III subunit delta' [Deltaproteobacteria bacterium]|nr:DNA polymerase III subunit delta' [Deltaproteobacteria bacterium]